MLRIVEVDSPDDPRLADYVRLTDASLRTHLEAAHGLFIAEGTKVITRAVASGYPVRSMLLGRSRLGDLESLPDVDHGGSSSGDVVGGGRLSGAGPGAAGSGR